MPCPACYCNCAPETVPVTVNNNEYTVVIDGDTVTWYDEHFALGGPSVVGGVQFFTANEIAVPAQVILFINNLPVPSDAYAVAGDRLSVSLSLGTLAAGDDLRIRYLGKAV